MASQLPLLEPIEVIEVDVAAAALSGLHAERLCLEQEVRAVEAAANDAEQWAEWLASSGEAPPQTLVDWWLGSLVATARADIKQSIAEPAADAALRRLVEANREVAAIAAAVERPAARAPGGLSPVVAPATPCEVALAAPCEADSQSLEATAVATPSATDAATFEQFWREHDDARAPRLMLAQPLVWMAAVVLVLMLLSRNFI